uniref:Uncharacterized protein n=1 Tax=Octopus bimaculoides TaxID=37653 RepID=A0A0L8FYC2_OCTBM
MGSLQKLYRVNYWQGVNRQSCRDYLVYSDKFIDFCTQTHTENHTYINLHVQNVHAYIFKLVIVTNTLTS